ncbi:MAG TPA: hypothetical protein VJC10_00285 [Patescibacteria group bacterium]|nr:hypothetical protein [Patescibacteria group bacterium]
MKKKQMQQIHSTTQKFTEIVDIVDNVVLLTGGNACAVVEVTSSNFTLLSKREQDGKIYSYASLLNSLSFPVQIIVRNKRIDISSYLKELEAAERSTQNELLELHIKLYREFVTEMVRVNVVLNKSFYIVIGYSSLEAGVQSVGGMKKSAKGAGAAADLNTQAAKKSLESKANNLISQLVKLSSAAKILGREELIKLFYDVYNEGILDASNTILDTKATIISMPQQGAPSI